MKALLKFLLLFSLIIIGKLVKEPITGDIAAKDAAANELPVHMISFFSRQATLQGGAAQEDGKQWWLQEPAQVSNN
ncbi:hypothetical protein GCM10011375_14760 [Hymenobacter qilianensis]|uniref:Uncharacterized protein n=2 Tax=Hymenobacter qilianensis TaxID=1385715 RepID=A0ACB5PQ22_9BACT|nr:hypothetical protein [Hymenobacter qilianensis]QNP53012.1 hypothetical protein H9L05_04825 [Hymenobacter qilianensis]GGF60689.1 hypothetical protein GCM10011375_14760 [Hymenobacter qilianensis]